MRQKFRGSPITVPPAVPLPAWAGRKAWGPHAWDDVRWIFFEAARRGLTMEALAAGGGVQIKWLERLRDGTQKKPDFGQICSVIDFLGRRLDLVDANSARCQQHIKMTNYESDLAAGEANLIEDYPGNREIAPKIRG